MSTRITDFLGSEEFRCFLLQGLNDSCAKKVLGSKKNKILDNELRVDGKRVYQYVPKLQGNRHASMCAFPCLIYLAAGIRDCIVTNDKKIGHLSQSFLTDLQVVFDAKAAVTNARRDAYELKRRRSERAATTTRCDAIKAAADSFLAVNHNKTVNVTSVHTHESQEAVRNLQLQPCQPTKVLQPFCFLLLSFINAYDLSYRSDHVPILDQVLLNGSDEGTVLYICISFVNMQ